MLCTTYKGRIYILKDNPNYNKEMQYDYMWYIIKNINDPNVIQHALMHINKIYLGVEY